eukprot:2996437-Alexandrium_andersonii.AAC.1
MTEPCSGAFRPMAFGLRPCLRFVRVWRSSPAPGAARKSSRATTCFGDAPGSARSVRNHGTTSGMWTPRNFLRSLSGVVLLRRCVSRVVVWVGGHSGVANGGGARRAPYAGEGLSLIHI